MVLCYLFPKQCFLAKNFQKLWYWAILAQVDVYDTTRSMGPNLEININYNLTWIFSIDSKFSYLVRLHFCEIQGNITKINQRVFDIFLYNQTAEQGADVIA